MSDTRIRTGGWTMIEAVTALAILGLLFTAWAQLESASANLNGLYRVRHECLSAGAAQLDSLAAVGSAIEAEDFKRVWPGLNANIRRTPGQGDWTGLTLVEVTVDGTVAEKPISVTQSRYMVLAEDHK
jgi:hypothetical protein